MISTLSMWMNARSDLYLYAKFLDILDLGEYCADLLLGFICAVNKGQILMNCNC
jgi:hypothetical protein